MATAVGSTASSTAWSGWKYEFILRFDEIVNIMVTASSIHWVANWSMDQHQKPSSPNEISAAAIASTDL